MKSFRSLLLCNLRLQFRQGFITAWALVSLFYILGLSFLPDSVVQRILPLILLSEPSTFAMIFTSAILLLERDEKLLENLFITPMSIRQYMISKALALSLPAALFCTLMALFLGSPSWRLLLIPPAVILTTLFFVILSYIPASASKDIMGVLGRIALYGSPFTLSLLDYFGWAAGYHHYILPTKGSLDLLAMGTGALVFTPLRLTLSLLSLGAGILLILPVSEKRFRRNLIESGGIA